MKIGIYSGSFDPLTNGHLWVIKEGARLFDELHVVLGPHPFKKALFSVEERLEILQECLNGLNVKITQMDGVNNVVDYANTLSLDHTDEFFALRGLRSFEDFDYENEICETYRKHKQELHHVFVIPPDDLRTTSSSELKELVEAGQWADAEAMVPEFVYEKVKAKWTEGSNVKSLPDLQWLVTNPEVASIFEQTTAGFAPAPSQDDLFELTSFDPIETIESLKDNFCRLSKNGFIKFPNVILPHQVREMLDPFPWDVVVSKEFRLMEIDINCVNPTGKRYHAMSRSLGPILVDANEAIGNETRLGYLGPAIIIEGKHRWLDAKDRGDKTILAWVGVKAIPHIKTYQPIVEGKERGLCYLNETSDLDDRPMPIVRKPQE